MSSRNIIKYLLFILTGIVISALALGIYTRVITPSVDSGDLQKVPPLQLVDKDVFITAITGEVFIIRNEIIQEALIGDALLEGDILKVVDQSYCQIQFSDRGSAGLDSNTVMLLKKLVNADTYKIRTEVLMGSMMYKVKKLQDKDDFQVESEGVLYDIKGTEFLVVKTPDGVLLAVNEGEVSLSSSTYGVDNLSVVEGEEIMLSKDQLFLPKVIPMGENASDRIKNLQGIGILKSLGHPSLVTLIVKPGGAEIYIDGRKTGTGSFTGLFEEGTELNFLIRKRGYRDKSFIHIVEPDKNEEIQINLLPSGLAETLDKNVLPVEDLLRNRIDQQERELLLLKESFENEKTGIGQIEEERDSLKMRNDQLQKEIDKKNEEIDQLKNLMIQIRDLSNQN